MSDNGGFLLEEVLKHLSLLPEHREQLKKERGFTDDMMDEYELKSCHPSNLPILENFIQENPGMSTSMNLFETHPHNPGKLRPSKQFLQSNILIPYRSITGELVKLRPHKLGFKGSSAKTFYGLNSKKKSLVCIIAESEFKAMAAEKFGYAAIGIPGIASMSGKNWKDFLQEVKTIETGEFVICFDNEIKSNPEFKNFKPDWRKRYDTFIYAYAMCQKLLNADVHCRIATLPKEWMENGKIDIDGALAQGKSIAEFKTQVIDKSIGPRKYIENAPIPEKHRAYVSRRIKKFFFNNSITVRNNSFYKEQTIKERGEEPRKVHVRLSNCIVSIKNVYEEVGKDGEGVRRDVIITDEYGMDTPPLQIHPGSMASKSGFTTWLMGQGNYLFYGKDPDVIPLWEYIFAHDEGDIVYLMNRCGYLPDYKFSLFKNVMIKDGEAIYADQSGIFWDNEVGYKVNEISENVVIPELSTEGNFEPRNFVRLLGDTTDSVEDGLGKALMGWVAAVIYIEAIVKKYKFFPILFLYGNRGSGKTTIMRGLASFFGLGSKTTMLSASTPVGVTRLLSYYSNLPLVLDDWRDDGKSRSYNTLFLGVYNRQVGAKGVKSNFGLAQTEIRSALAMMGEEMISDNGLATRCTSFYIPMERKRECLDEVEEIIPYASKYFFDRLTTDHEETGEKVIAKIESASAYFRKEVNNVEQRTILNYSVLLGSYEALFGEDIHLRKFLIKKIQEKQSEMSAGDKLHTFAQEFLIGVAEHQLQPHHYKYSPDGKRVTLWVKGICDLMNKFYNRYGDSSTIIQKHFTQQPYFVRAMKAEFKGSAGVLPSVELDLTKMPDSMRHYYEGANDGFDQDEQQLGD